ncbi:hypothetical protein LTR94_023029 [Friedmanniomyces endolithicus]|nr:hypothetical protein LTR94_023029 [Friedmanniomyces endolithicus]
MLVHLGVFLTFDSAIRAGLGASLEHALDQCLVAAGATRGEAGRGQADVGAIKIEADALGEILHHILGQAGIGADVAHRGAAVSRFDRANETVVDASAHVGMGADHWLDLHRRAPWLIGVQPKRRDGVPNGDASGYPADDHRLLPGATDR